ncbi:MULTISPECIES: hypothetical protein [Planktothricoides]|uniref:Uncharacterized protein n=2 Tax=Planktothricoides raciborskii TaxID=132608 RepID=A0AAU8JCL5_9CYAN|nr:MULTISPECIES: hypothetical protein [Planktothricoides]MBD2542742.1 hypothetical protein [Planktothricoides raciborskii FACHB-1370]MBD2581511.1 hypothetical protein [Planktothricoides raciborskii FACHB-1261]
MLSIQPDGSSPIYLSELCCFCLICVPAIEQTHPQDGLPRSPKSLAHLGNFLPLKLAMIF